TTKPSPPPVAPKPGLISQPLAVSQPSPSTLKRAKPAVAPKPCIPKSSAASSPQVSPPPPPKPAELLIPSQEQQETLDDGLNLLNSKNGILSEASRRESDYIIPTCSCGLRDCTQCQPLENGSTSEAGGHSHKEVLENGVSKKGFVGSKPRKGGENQEEGIPEDKGESVQISKKPRGKPQRQKHLDRGPVSKEVQRTEEQEVTLKNQESPAAEPDVSKVSTEAQNTHLKSACDVIGGIIVFSSIVPLESPTEHSERSNTVSRVSPTRSHPDLQVPAAPSKPLPVPQPRKLKKPALVRQDGLEGGAQESVRMNPNLNKNNSHSLDLLSQPDSVSHSKEGEARRAEEDEEDGYGDFERYPISHSLPKQIKLSCHPPLANDRKASSAEEEQSPRAPPRKPQRYSLPAPPPPSICPPAPPHANTPMRELPAPPQEKTSWRFTRPCVTFFSRQIPTRSSVPPKSRAPVLGGKQRAQSFSAADLATRANSPKRSLSFRKLLELRLSVKMLPKLLAKGGQSLDCTSVESNRGKRSLERPSSCIGEADICGEGIEGSAEYENVPLYEEIPEYMNLPFHSARLGWPHDPDAADADIYEVQDPYHRCHEHEYERYAALFINFFSDVHSEEEEIHSSDDEDNSSTSSKEHMDEADRQVLLISCSKVCRHVPLPACPAVSVCVQSFVRINPCVSLQDFRDAVAKATRQNGKPVVDERILCQILYYLPQLYQLNKDLLRELEERVAHWSDHQRLSDIFVQKGPYLKMYSTYIRQFDNNVALLDEQCRKNPAFAAVVREFEMSPRCASLALKHYLLKPVQRIPQYQLLLTDYLKNLPEDSEDYKDTQAALSIVKEVANHANDIMKQGDNFQKLMQIQYSLNGHHEIVQPGRVFLKEGTLMKLSRKVMQPRMFFLFNDALMYTTPVQSAQYKLNSVLSLAGMKVSKPSQEAYQNELNIESVERSFILSASSATERDEWLEAIAKAIDDYTKKKISFISSRSQEEVRTGAPLGSKAPIWIPDLRATMCMICTCEFTLTWRRHHCRACGKVVCQACSANKYYLEYLKNQPARVCDHCFSKLQENSEYKEKLLWIISRFIFHIFFQVSANTENSSMSGYLNRSKGNKKQWKRLWFVIKNKVLYTYAASEDVAALESQPLLGFFLREEKNGPAQKLQFKLYHKNTLFYIFKADDIPTAQRYLTNSPVMW
uniref:FYVE, RhoGEF and PH domain containing 6 n=1 Tax=Oreochromis niloticus TaxID=8128 RepID=A0A669CS22_ORENI